MEELQKCKMLFSQPKFNILKNFAEVIEKEIKITEEKVLGYFSNSNSFDNSNNNERNRVMKINDKNYDYMRNNFDNNKFGEDNSFNNLMGKFGNK